MSDAPEFSFNASHYSDAQLTEKGHDYELVPSKETYLYLDYKNSGIGSNSCGPALDPKWRLKEKEFAFTIRLKPTSLVD